MHRLLAVLLCMAVLLGSQTHLFVAQVIGWSTMLGDQWAITGSLPQAVENVLSGSEPCEWCGLVESAQEEEQRALPTNVPVSREGKLFTAAQPILRAPGSTPPRTPPAKSAHWTLPAQWTGTPPTPPPRA